MKGKRGGGFIYITSDNTAWSLTESHGVHVIKTKPLLIEGKYGKYMIEQAL